MLLAGWQSLLHRAIEGDQLASMTKRDQNQIDVGHLLHGLFLGQCVRDILRRNLAAGVMHQNAVLPVGGGHGGKFGFRLAILRDGEFFAVRDLFEQIRESGLDFFKGDRLHNSSKQ